MVSETTEIIYSRFWVCQRNNRVFDRTYYVVKTAINVCCPSVANKNRCHKQLFRCYNNLFFTVIKCYHFFDIYPPVFRVIATMRCVAVSLQSRNLFFVVFLRLTIRLRHHNSIYLDSSYFVNRLAYLYLITTRNKLLIGYCACGIAGSWRRAPGHCSLFAPLLADQAVLYCLLYRVEFLKHMSVYGTIHAKLSALLYFSVLRFAVITHFIILTYRFYGCYSDCCHFRSVYRNLVSTQAHSPFCFLKEKAW